MSTGSSKGDSVAPRSSKNLWVLLSGTTILKSKEFIGRSLEQDANRLLRGILFFQPRQTKDDTRELETLKSITGDVPPEFIQKLSINLNIESTVGLDLFLSYIIREYTGSVKSFMSCFSCEQNIQDLLSDLSDYYYSERLFGLFSLKEILSNWSPHSTHVYQQIFRDFLTAINKDGNGTIFNSILDQLEYLLKSQPPPYAFRGQGLFPGSEASCLKWTENSIRERFELDQLLILAANHSKPNIDQIIRLLSLFTEYGHASTSHGEITLSPELQSILKYTGVIESLLIVECLQVDSLTECIETESKDHLLLKDPVKLRNLNQMILNLSISVVSNSIIFLGWMVIRSWELEPFDSKSSSDAVRFLGRESLRMDSFATIANFLTCELFFKSFAETHVGTLLKKTSGDLMSVLFSVYRLEDLAPHKINSIYLLAQEVMGIFDVIDGNPDSGLLTILKHSMAYLPTDTLSFLKLLPTVIRRGTFEKLYDMVADIKICGETLSVPTSFLKAHPSEEGYFLSTGQRVTGSGPCKVMIPEGSVARLIRSHPEDKAIDIEWVSQVSFNGWNLLKNIYREKLMFASKGHLAPLESNLGDMSLINDLCTTIITKCARVPMIITDLLKMASEGLKLFSKHEKVPRVYISSVINLITAVIQKKGNANDLWDLVVDSCILPYVTGYSRDVPSLVSGGISVSVVGRILVSEECITGDFKVCLAYLNLVSSSISTIPVSETLMACLIHIFSEIFPVYHLWHYRNKMDASKIGFACYTLAHRILEMKSAHASQQLIEVIRVILTTGAPGERLLHMIRTGKDVVTQVVRRMGTEVSLMSPEVVMVRLSLSILNQLLRLSEHKSKDKKKQMVVGKEILSSSHSGEASKHLVTDKSSLASHNMLIIISHYVFQPYDSRLAALSVQLLKRLAKNFPMSIMACLGSEAEAVREHFLHRLDAVTEDIRVKIALLDFLSICSKYQPGLMELFVNVDNNGHSAPDDEKNSVLQTVLDILKEKKNGKIFCPLELHSASLRFLTQFWIHSNIMVIDCLKKCPDFWDLLTFPLMTSPSQMALSYDNEDINEKLISYILKIIAREIYFSKNIHGRSPDEEFQSLLMKLSPKLETISSALRISASGTHMDFMESGEKTCLVSGWRDLMVALGKHDPIPVNQKLRYTLYVDLVHVLKLQLNGCHEVQSALSESCLILLNEWAEDINYKCCDDEWIESTADILYSMNEMKDKLTFHVLITLQALMTKTIMVVEDDGLKRNRLLDWITPASGLLMHSMRILEKVISDQNVTLEQKLPIASLTMFNQLFSATCGSSSIWIPALKSSTVVDTLSHVLKTLLEKKMAVDVAQSILHVLISLSADGPTAELVVSHESLRGIRMSFKLVCDFCLHIPKPEKECPHVVWTKVYILSLRLASTLLMNLQQFFVKDALELINANHERICECLKRLRNSPSLELLAEASEVISFIRGLAYFKHYWISNYDMSFKTLMREVSMTCHSVTAFILRPHIFNYWLQHPTKTSGAAQKSLFRESLQQPNLTSSFSPLDRRLASEKAIAAELSSKISPEAEDLLQRILMFSISTLNSISPDLNGLLKGMQKPQEEHEKVSLFLSMNFSMPNIDSEKDSSFGSLLHTMSYCITELNSQADRTSSTKGILGDPQNLLYIIETSLRLIVSQALVSQLDPEVLARDKSVVSRELNSEVQTIMSSMNRRRSSSSSISPSVAEIGMTPVMKRLVQHLNRLVQPQATLD